MLTLFFNNQSVTDWDALLKSDTSRYSKYFWSLIEQGIYMPCSQFEALFVSATHTEADIQETIRAVHNAMASLATDSSGPAWAAGKRVKRPRDASSRSRSQSEGYIAPIARGCRGKRHKLNGPIMKVAQAMIGQSDWFPAMASRIHPEFDTTRSRIQSVNIQRNPKWASHNST